MTPLYDLDDFAEEPRRRRITDEYLDQLAADAKQSAADKGDFGDDDGKLGNPPGPGSAPSVLAAFLTHGYGLPTGYVVSRIVRHGGRSGTGLVVMIDAPPGKGPDLRISYDRESDCTNPVRLRAQAAADTKGLTRSHRINSPKAAVAMYEVMCSLADTFEAADQREETWEWVQQLRRVAAETPGSPDAYQSLKRLQRHEYSKKLVQDPPLGKDKQPMRPVPLLLVDPGTGYRYVTARHMAVFLRYDLGVEDAGSDDRILTRLSDIDGERVYVEEWDSPGRDREDKVRLVLYRLPEEVDE